MAEVKSSNNEQKTAAAQRRVEEHVMVVNCKWQRYAPDPRSCLVGGLLSPVTAVQCLRGNPLLLDEQVNQGLHRLHLLVGDQLVVLGNSHEVHEAHVQDVVLVDVPEWVQPVSMVQVCIAAEHLLHDTLAVLVESLREATRLANPLVSGSVAVRASWVGALGRGWGRCTGGDGILQRGGLGDAGHLLGREHDGVVDLADNPFLDAVDELRRRDLGRTTVHEPGVGQPGER